MEGLLMVLAKFKVFIYGTISGFIIQGFELKIGNIKFQLLPIIFSALSFGFLAEFANLVILGELIKIDGNDNTVLVYDMIIATVLYLGIPYILKSENRERILTGIIDRILNNKK